MASAADNSKSSSSHHHSRDGDDDALDDLATKRAKTGGSEFNYEEENAALRAALHAAREEVKAAREETSSALQREQAALEEIAALKEKFKAELRAERLADERRPWLEKHGFDPDDPTKMATKTFVNGRDIEVTPMIWACYHGDLEMLSLIHI